MTTKFNAKSTADEVLSGVNLNGKRILITGASSGIGLETARSLVSHGASIVGTVRNLGKAEAVTALILDAAAQGGGRFEFIELELASLQSISACADKLLANGSQFDVIIANAGPHSVGRLTVLKYSSGRTILDILL